MGPRPGGPLPFRLQKLGDTKYALIPHGRYINFLADFLEHEPRATHAQARKAWHELKSLALPKTYAAWRTR